MIKNYIFGKPIKTDAVIEPVEEIRDFSYEEVPFVTVGKNDKDDLTIHYDLAAEDIVYGLGETMRGINKRGGRYISYNTDDPKHRPDMPSMYGSHNFLIVDCADDATQKFGIFVDTPAKVIFAIDYEKSGAIDIRAKTDKMNLYIMTGDTAYDIVRQFLAVIGKSHIPPLYAFGYGQSRWGYKNEKDIREVVAGYEKIGVPLDYICMDIDYMDRYIDFTINKKRFPNFAGFVKDIRKHGVHLVPIIDAGIKIEPGNEVYEEGIANNYFCTNAEGKPFGAAVWPGMTHFTDFFKPEAREWFGSKYKLLTDLGIDGFWNDMNEPAIFYTESTKGGGLMGMAKSYLMPQKIEEDGTSTNESNAYKGYKEFYHEIEGEKVLHHDVHNLFGGLMTRAAGEYLDKELDGKYFLFSRSSYIGAHRYGGIWTGDNNSSWEMLRQNLWHMANLNMTGFIYTGADTGGFGGNCDRELMLRWLALSAWTPLMRNHTSRGTKEQECYQYDNTEDFKSIVSLRYRMLPYIYETFCAAAEAQDMYMKPLAFVYDKDDRAKKTEDQLMVGESIMIAPVMDQGQTIRRVYLPENMIEVRYDGRNFTCEEKQKGDYYVKVPLNEVVFYIRDGHKVKVANKLYMNTDVMDMNDVSEIG